MSDGKTQGGRGAYISQRGKEYMLRESFEKNECLGIECIYVEMKKI